MPFPSQPRVPYKSLLRHRREDGDDLGVPYATWRQGNVGDDQFVLGHVAIEEVLISAVGLSPVGKSGLVVSGFIDVQINDFEGVDFAWAEANDYTHVARKPAAMGIAFFQPTRISLPESKYLNALGSLRPSDIREGRILDMHLEGPFPSQFGRGGLILERFNPEATPTSALWMIRSRSEGKSCSGPSPSRSSAQHGAEN